MGFVMAFAAQVHHEPVSIGDTAFCRTPDQMVSFSIRIPAANKAFTHCPYFLSACAHLKRKTAMFYIMPTRLAFSSIQYLMHDHNFASEFPRHNQIRLPSYSCPFPHFLHKIRIKIYWLLSAQTRRFLCAMQFHAHIQQNAFFALFWQCFWHSVNVHCIILTLQL